MPAVSLEAILRHRLAHFDVNPVGQLAQSGILLAV
jgi:hypothetical protein